MMASVLDVAAYILEKCGELTTMKLQKLVYYCQAWHLVWDEEPLFREPIQAWANGPVVPRLYQAHQGQFKISKIENGEATRLTQAQRETIDSVLVSYADKSSQWLSDLTHMEAPWRDARKGIPLGERGNREISHASLAEYYLSL